MTAKRMKLSETKRRRPKIQKDSEYDIPMLIIADTHLDKQELHCRGWFCGIITSFNFHGRRWWCSLGWSGNSTTLELWESIWERRRFAVVGKLWETVSNQGWNWKLKIYKRATVGHFSHQGSFFAPLWNGNKYVHHIRAKHGLKNRTGLVDQTELGHKKKFTKQIKSRLNQ